VQGVEADEPPGVLGADDGEVRVELLQVGAVDRDVRVLVVGEDEVDVAQVPADLADLAGERHQVAGRARIHQQVHHRPAFLLEDPQVDVALEQRALALADPVAVGGDLDGPAQVDVFGHGGLGA